MTDDHSVFAAMLEAFSPSDPLRARVIRVLQALPGEVSRGFLEDPRFRIARLGEQAAAGSMLLSLPGSKGQHSRCVVLKQRLADCPEAFGLYVIAHELAHAHLYNGGWGEITDPEDAADALAASWGFPRPQPRRR